MHFEGFELPEGISTNSQEAGEGGVKEAASEAGEARYFVAAANPPPPLAK